VEAAWAPATGRLSAPEEDTGEATGVATVEGTEHTTVVRTEEVMGMDTEEATEEDVALDMEEGTGWATGVVHSGGNTAEGTEMATGVD
jgi:hypothetical protein